MRNHILSNTMLKCKRDSFLRSLLSALKYFLFSLLHFDTMLTLLFQLVYRASTQELRMAAGHRLQSCPSSSAGSWGASSPRRDIRTRTRWEHQFLQTQRRWLGGLYTYYWISAKHLHVSYSRSGWVRSATFLFYGARRPFKLVSQPISISAKLGTATWLSWWVLLS